MVNRGTASRLISTDSIAYKVGVLIPSSVSSCQRKIAIQPINSTCEMGVVSPLSVHGLWNKDRSQKLSDGPNMISESSSHGWGTLLPACLTSRICYFYS